MAGIELAGEPGVHRGTSGRDLLTAGALDRDHHTGRALPAHASSRTVAADTEGSTEECDPEGSVRQTHSLRPSGRFANCAFARAGCRSRDMAGFLVASRSVHHPGDSLIYRLRVHPRVETVAV